MKFYGVVLFYVQRQLILPNMKPTSIQYPAPAYHLLNSGSRDARVDPSDYLP